MDETQPPSHLEPVQIHIELSIQINIHLLHTIQIIYLFHTGIKNTLVIIV